MVKTPVVSSKTRVMVYVLKRLSWRRRPLNLAQRNLITITPPLLPLGEMGAKSIVQSRCRLPSSWQARPRVPYNYPHRFRMKVNGDRATGGLGGTETVASLSEVVIRLAHRIDRSSSNSFRREGPKLQYMQNKGDGQDLEARPGLARGLLQLWQPPDRKKSCQGRLRGTTPSGVEHAAANERQRGRGRRDSGAVVRMTPRRTARLESRLQPD